MLHPAIYHDPLIKILTYGDSGLPTLNVKYLKRGMGFKKCS
jgi:hypothetical protein